MKKRILITGGGGSLGLAFVGLLHKDNEIVVVENNEGAVAELQSKYPGVTCLMQDFADYHFDQEPVEYVIHCAAYKHVNLGENNPEAFIENNVIKTAQFLRRAYRFGCSILFISTDKAVEPISVYGFTNALGER